MMNGTRHTLEHHDSKGRRCRLCRPTGLLLGDLLGRAFLAAGAFLAGAAFLAGPSGRRGLLDGLLHRRGDVLGLARQLDTDQLGGALTDGAGLGGDGAQRVLGQLDGLVDVARPGRRRP
jgi:hypothetical protein